MLALDTNALVRLLARDDARQAAAADKFVAKGAWVSHLVLAETLWVLGSVYDRTPSQQITLVEMLLDHESLVLQDADTVTAALAHFQKKPVLGFSDCLVLEIARRAGHVPLGTFERSLAKLPGAQAVKV
jgi:predicted nucleic-acid-binding protein